MIGYMGGQVPDPLDRRQVCDVLNELSGAEGEGQQLETARLHPFPARMPLSLAEYLIKNLTTQVATVLDPMAGSGTTLIAARRLGRKSIGIDRDPLAVLVARSTIQSFE